MCFLCFIKLEDESDEDQGRQVVVIFDFELKLNQSSIAVHLPPYDDYKEDNSIQELPWLDTTRAGCNCSRYPNVQNVGVRGRPVFGTSQTHSDSSASDESDSENDLSDPELDHSSTVAGSSAVAAGSSSGSAAASTAGGGSVASADSGSAVTSAASSAGGATGADDEGAEELQQYAEYFKIKGSTYHDHFQKALRQSKRMLLNKQEVPVQLIIEPINLKDENAIVVQAEIEGKWHPVGYIPGKKVAKAMDALEKKELTSIKFKSIEWKYIYGLGEFRYISSIVATKLNKWLKSTDDYQYNDIL